MKDVWICFELKHVVYIFLHVGYRSTMSRDDWLVLMRNSGVAVYPIIYCQGFSNAVIAQLGEQQTEVLEVACSIQAHGT